MHILVISILFFRNVNPKYFLIKVGDETAPSLSARKSLETGTRRQMFDPQYFLIEVGNETEQNVSASKNLESGVIRNLVDDKLGSNPCRGYAGANIPSPFDRCNSCFCTKDEKIGGCTKMGCSNKKDYDCVEYNTDYYANDIVNYHETPIEYSWYGCKKLCRKYAGCKYWTFFSYSKKCLLKTSKAGKRIMQGATSGSRKCGSHYDHSCKHCSENVESLSFKKMNRLRKGMRRLHVTSDFVEIASIHAEPVGRWCPGYYCCPHGLTNGYFLPWHRLYIKTINEAIGVVMPYWDWTTSAFPGMAYHPLIGYRQIPNPFYPGFVSYLGRNTVREWGGISTKSILNRVLYALTEDDFLIFTKQLEDIHNDIHRYVGGDMYSVDNASYDPIFFLHHTFVDLVWAVHQKLHEGLEGSGPSNAILYHQMDPFEWTIGQSLTINKYNLNFNSKTIVFGDMTLAQIKDEVQVRTPRRVRGVGFEEVILSNGSQVAVENKTYAGFFVRSFGTSGTIKFNICNQEECNYEGGEVSIFGGKHERPFISSDPTKVDVTEVAKNANILNVKHLKFSVPFLENKEGKTLPIKIFQPIRVLRLGMGENDVYTIFFNKNYIQPPTIRIPKNTIFEIESPYGKIIITENQDDYLRCNQKDNEVVYSGEQINVNAGNYYFFDNDCKPQIRKEDFGKELDNVSKVHILKE